MLTIIVEPQISHFVNFTPCEDLVPKRHFCQTWTLGMVNWRSKICAKISHLYFLTCDESVRIVLPVKNWYDFFSDVKNWCLFFTDVSDRISL